MAGAAAAGAGAEAAWPPGFERVGAEALAAEGVGGAMDFAGAAAGAGAGAGAEAMGAGAAGAGGPPAGIAGSLIVEAACFGGVGKGMRTVSFLG